VANNSSSRTKSQIEADIGATRDRLTSSVEGLIDQIHPNRIKQREIAQVKTLINGELENAKSLVFNARGDLRKERLAIVAGAVAGAIGFLVIIRAIVRRGRSS
jgi:ribosomal protein L3